MKNKLLLGIVLSSFLVIINCKKNTPEEEVLPKQLTSSNLDFRTYWSPNGEYIAFYTQRNTYNPYVAESPFELWIMNRDGSDQRPLIQVDEIYENTAVSIISWTPDSKNIMVHIYNNSLNDYKSEIWRITVKGDKTRLYTPNFRLHHISYSPDATKTAFIIEEKLYTADTDLSDTVFIERGLITDYKWKIDSKGLIYSLYDRTNENYDLWESSVDGVDKIRISETPENEESLSCSYDGKYIAYSDYKAVYITLTDTFASKLIMDNARLPQWIPNRNLIFLYSDQSLDNKSWTESWIVDIQGNIIIKIAEGAFSEVSFSSTGDYFTYTVNGNIWFDYLPY